MMIIQNINNNILILNPYYLGIHQDEYKKLDHHQDKIFFFGWKKNKLLKCSSCYSCNNQNMKKTRFLEWLLSVVGLSIEKIEILM